MLGSAIRTPSKMGGEASMRFCLDAIEAANRKLVDAVVTAPIAKESWKLAGYHYPGHTELFAQRTGCPPLRDDVRRRPAEGRPGHRAHPADGPVGQAEHRRGLPADRADAPGDGRTGSTSPSRASPSAASTRTPARTASSATKKNASSPPPSSWPASRASTSPAPTRPTRFSCAPATASSTPSSRCTTTRGLIPVKLLAFDRAVNLTLGLPIIRTSPDHGTAFDIVGRNRANPGCMRAAMN